MTDPAGKWKTLTSDSLGNPTTVLEPDPGGTTVTTSYAYDWMNHVSQVTMTRGGTTQTRTFTYNDQGDLTSSVTPESGTANYYYNPNHTLWYKHDANGQDTVYSYGSALRVTLIQRYPTGKSNAEDTCARVTNYLSWAQGRPIACMAWSSAPRHLGSRDRYIGWSAEARRRSN